MWTSARSILLLACVAAVPQDPVPAPSLPDAPVPGPGDAPATAVTLAREKGRQGPRTAETLAEFDRLLGADSPAPADDAAIASELRAIAADRAANPGPHATLTKHYVEGIDPRKRAPVAPGLLPEHCAQAYRLAWEYLLIAPGPWPSSVDQRAIEALGLIADDTALVALRFSFDATCAAGVKLHDVGVRQIWLLHGIAMVGSAKALATVLHCLDASNLQVAAGGKDPRFDHEGQLAAFLKPHLADGTAIGDRWRTLLRDGPADGTTPAQRACFERLQQTLLKTR